MCPSEWHPVLGEPYPPTPNLDRMQEVKADADVLTRFVDWLVANDMEIAKRGEYTEVTISCLECVGSGGDVSQLTPRQRQVAKVAGTYRDVGGVPPCENCDGTGKVLIPTVKTEALVPVGRSFEQLFCDHFGVDHEQVQIEKHGLYEVLSQQNATDQHARAQAHADAA